MSKVWFITGAGSGIGAATAKAALKTGERVVATGRDVEKVRNALKDVAGGNLEVLELDVLDAALSTITVHGGRMNEEQMRVVDKTAW